MHENNETTRVITQKCLISIPIWKVISYLKGIAIISMLLNHAAFFSVIVYRFKGQNPQVSQPFGPFWETIMPAWTLLQELTRFCIPLFILITGYFLTKFQLNKSAMWGQIKKLLIPFLFWSVLETIHILLYRRAAINPKQIVLDFISGTNLPGYYYFPLVIQFYLISPWFVRWVKKAPLFLLISSFFIQALWIATKYLAVAGQYNLFNNGFTFPGFYEFLFPRYLFFYILGIKIAFYPEDFLQFLGNNLILITGLTILSGLAVLGEHGYLLRLIHKPMEQINLWTYFVAMSQWKISTTLWSWAFILFLFALGIFNRLSFKWLNQVGGKSLVIYILNGPIIIALTHLLNRIPTSASFEGFTFLAFFIVTLYIPEFVTKLVSRWMPWFKPLIGLS